MANLSDIAQHCKTVLAVDQFEDYCPNGLQVEGKRDIKVLISGVTACQALLDAAIDAKADAVLVHHGYFWRGENPVITGMAKQRLQRLLQHDISLLAYHLPLDAHPVFGNNAQLARVLELDCSDQTRAPQDLIFVGELAQPLKPTAFAQYISQRLSREPLHIAAGPDKIQRVAWCTGAAQDFIQQAADLGVDAYISGEVSERTFHQAQELGIHYYACGHHATERYGVQALGDHLAKQFDIKHKFIDIPNPV